jgi:mRNA-degrading endonuclease toxin of MazEF toxin-antitoxin module
VVVMTLDELVDGHSDDLLIVVPLSASRSKSALRVEIVGVDGIDRPSVAVVPAARAIARSRLRLKVATLPPDTLADVANRLAAVIGWPRQGL